MEILGIDIGGSGIKGAPVNVVKGVLASDRHRIPTPQPSVPDAVGDVVAEIVRHFNWHGPIGCTFPAIVKNGMVNLAANVDKKWIGADAKTLFEQKTACPLVVVNDADAAGIAEMEFGAGRGHQGTVIMLTFGTGIGSAIFVNGTLVPNTEFGHLKMRGKGAEKRASDRVRTKKGLSWKKWGAVVSEYLEYMELLFSPDLFILGGGVSKKHQKFLRYFRSKAPIVPAQLLNEAGIVGAALAARHLAVPSPGSE